MTDCDICYCSIENKVKLECSHEFCLKCIVNILKTIYDVLTCPMCRKKYEDIYINKEINEEVPFEDPFDGPGYDISIVKQNTCCLLFGPHTKYKNLLLPQCSQNYS